MTSPLRIQFDPTSLAKYGRLALIARKLVEGFLNGVHKSPYKGFLLVLWLYRHELRLVHRWIACGLLFLRLAVVLLILILVGLQPIVARLTTEELPGRLLIAVDR